MTTPSAPYRGPLQALILDWAGTVIDHGSRAPMGAFVRAFAAFDVAITIDEARGPMGMAKWDHIFGVGTLPRVSAAWTTRHGKPFAAADADRVFEVFEPMNVASVRDHADIIPGAIAAIDAARARGLRIAATTGYTRPIMAIVEPLAAAAGYAPEFTVCAGDLAAGRPSPLMMWHTMARLGVHPAASVVKIDDTPVGIGEGLAAGTWTIGLSLSGNMAGLSAAELAALAPAERDALRARAQAPLRAAGAHQVIDSLADLGPALDRIVAALALGARP
jgi:phosphonoacetaldehyde hydrolase